MRCIMEWFKPNSIRIPAASVYSYAYSQRSITHQGPKMELAWAHSKIGRATNDPSSTAELRQADTGIGLR